MNISSGQTALITGASRGIGRAAAECFARAGYSLVLTCERSMDSLRAWAEELSAKYNISCLAMQIGRAHV